MQEVKVNLFRAAGKAVVYLMAGTLLIAAWVAIAFAFKAILSAVDIYGLSITNIILDAELSYLGFLSLGLSSCALIIASSSMIKDKLRHHIKIFRITFFVGLFLIVPTIVAIALYLVN